MSPLPLAPPVRFGAAPLPTEMEVSLARRGGRAFAPRGRGGDVRVTLPEVGGVPTVLVPRGFGHPLPARRLGQELRAEPGGEPCAPARWVPTGGVAAWVRAVPPPRGPVRATEPIAPGDGKGPWVWVRPANLEWSAVRLLTPAAGHGPVAVADRWVRAVSPEARARGVCRGMSVSLARRRCPGLTVWPRPVGGLGAEVERRLSEWLGAVERAGGGFLARLGEDTALEPGSLGPVERLARLLWQELGVEAAVAVASTAEAARGLGRWLAPGWVGVSAPLASQAWGERAPAVARCVGGAARAAWSGPAIPDLEGAASRARLLAQGLARGANGASGGALRIRLTGGRGGRVLRLRVPEGIGRGALARLVEAVVRREAVILGPIEGIALACVTARPAGERARPKEKAARARPAVAAEPGMPAADAVARAAEGRRRRLASALRAAAALSAGAREPSAQLALLPGLR